MDFIVDFTSSHAITLSALILVVSYILIAFEKFNKVAVALSGGFLSVFIGLLSDRKSEALYYINYIDFNVVFLLVGMMIIVAIVSRSGIFNFLAVKLMSLTGGRPLVVMLSLMFFTAFVSAFLDNVTTVIIVMPITFAVAKKLSLPPEPMLIGEVFASNIGGTATLIGDPPNIIIGSAANLSFMDFLEVLTPVVAMILICVCLFMALVFRRKFQAARENPNAFDGSSASKIIKNYPRMFRAVAVLLLVVTGLIFHDFLGLQSSAIAMLGASALLLFEDPQEIFKEVEWNTIFFFIGLFMIVGALEASGGIKIMAESLLKFTDGSHGMTAMIVLWASGAISGVIDNIPYTATMAPMIAEISKSMGAQYAEVLWWALSLGACLGGNMTIIGAAANVIVSEQAAKHGHAISFMEFFKYGIAVVFISLLVSSLYLYVRFL